MYDENEKINVVPLENITQALPVITSEQVRQSVPPANTSNVMQVNQPSPTVQVATPTTSAVQASQQPTIVKKVVVVKRAQVQGPVVVANKPADATIPTVSNVQGAFVPAGQAVVTQNIANAISTVSPVQQVVNTQSVAASTIQTPVQTAQPIQDTVQAPVQNAQSQVVVQAPAQTAKSQSEVQATAQTTQSQLEVQAPVQNVPTQDANQTNQPVDNNKTQKSKEKKPINKKSLFILIGLIAVLIIAIIVLYFTGYFNSLFGTSNTNTDVVVDGKKIYFYQDGDYYQGSMYENTSLSLINTYTCVSNDCILDSTSSSSITYAVIYDNEYVLYDYKNNLEYKTGISGYGNEIDDNGFTSMFVYDSDYKLKGIAFNYIESENEKFAFYSLTSQKVTYKSTDWIIYIGNDNNPGSNDTVYTDKGYLAVARYTGEGYQSKLINFETGTDVEDSIVDGVYTSLFDSNNNITYPALIDDYNSSNPRYVVLSSALKPIVNKFGYLSYADQWNVYMFDGTSTYYLLTYLTGKSETLNCDLGNVVDIVNNKYFVILNNNKLSIYDKNTNALVSDITTIDSNYSYVHSVSGLNENSIILAIASNDTGSICGQYEYNLNTGELTVDAECVQ